MLRKSSAIHLTYNMSVIYCNSCEASTRGKCILLFKLVWTKRLYDCNATTLVATTLVTILYISYTFTNMTKPFISITFVVPHWSNVFFFFHMSFLESKYNIFRFFFVFCFQEQELSCLSRVCLWISLFAYLISSSILIGSFK